jgi:ParB family transcriptional regulator, chromosome partitioning protein
MEKEPNAAIEAVDVPIVKLVPVRKREVSARSYAKLLANIKAVGLIEPLCVYLEGEQYYILDGYVRYQILVELGVAVVPCLVLKTKDLYTPNRQVNYLTAKQETKLLREALEQVGEERLSAAFGMKDRHSLTRLDKELQPGVLKAVKEGRLTRGAAQELVFVTPRRQEEILEAMKRAGDWSRAFARAQVLRTGQKERSKKVRKVNPWERGGERRRTLAKKLQEVGKHHDFYSGLYRQYVGDLLKLAIHVRQLVTRPKIREYLSRKEPEVLRLFESIVAESEGQAAAV